jgi:hypothetical protein
MTPIINTITVVVNEKILRTASPGRCRARRSARERNLAIKELKKLLEYYESADYP